LSANSFAMNQLVITEKTLDVRKAFRDKSPGLSKWIPGFIYSFVEKKIHQKQLNEFLYQNKDKQGLDFVKASLETLDIKLKVVGEENILPEGRITIAANHPIGGPEGLGLMKIVGEVREDITFLANDILMQIPNINQFFTPVNTLGSNEDYLRFFIETFRSDKAVLIFPAGLVSRKQKGKIRDLLWKSSYISRAIKYKRTIIPCHIDGKNSNFFYNLSNWRSKLGIKANLEMFLLPDEMYKQAGNTITFTFGKPVSYTVFDERMNRHKWSALFKDYVYKLKDNPDLVFDLDYIKSLNLEL
jgi:putative hemolysin